MKFRRRRRSLPLSPPTEGWKPGELDLRRREVAAAERTTRSQKWVQLAQVLSVVVALSSTVVALVAARQSNEATQSAAQLSAQQAAESQLTSAIGSLDVGSSSVRITQMLLIERDVTGIMSLPFSTNEEEQDAYSDYTTSLQALTVYLDSHTPARTSSFGPGYGTPPASGLPGDLSYAANTLHDLIDMGNAQNISSTLHATPPIVNLSRVTLFNELLPGTNLSWVISDLTGADLRGAILEFSSFSLTSNLEFSYLQCADLQGADFRGADLAYADLRGADVDNANFSGANLTGARLTSLYGHATWPKGTRNIITLPGQFNQAACLRNSKFWDNQPTAGNSRQPPA